MYIYLCKEFGRCLLKIGNFELSIILLSIQNETIQEEAFASSCLMVVTPMMVGIATSVCFNSFCGVLQTAVQVEAL